MRWSPVHRFLPSHQNTHLRSNFSESCNDIPGLTVRTDPLSLARKLGKSSTILATFSTNHHRECFVAETHFDKDNIPLECVHTAVHNHLRQSPKWTSNNLTQSRPVERARLKFLELFVNAALVHLSTGIVRWS